jgi:hypothetical protein
MFRMCQTICQVPSGHFQNGNIILKKLIPLYPLTPRKLAQRRFAVFLEFLGQSNTIFEVAATLDLVGGGG